MKISRGVPGNPTSFQYMFGATVAFYMVAHYIKNIFLLRSASVQFTFSLRVSPEYTFSFIVAVMSSPVRGYCVSNNIWISVILRQKYICNNNSVDMDIQQDIWCINA